MPNKRRSGADEPTRPKTKRRRRWILYTLLVFLGLMLGVAGAASAFVYKAYQTLPAIEEFDPTQSSVILDNKGNTVYTLHAAENRKVLKDISEVPVDVQKAFIATEDHRFRDHHGIDMYRMFGSVWSDLKYFAGVKGAQFEGGSTITMQLARNEFLTLDQNMTRKVQEMLIALQLERRYTKDEILLQYLNQVSFGGTNSGLETASETYFSKPAKDLTLSEGAMLAGILKGPSEYDPISNFSGAMERRGIVLDLMAEYGYITPAEAVKLKAEKVVLHPAPAVTGGKVAFTGDWYVDYVQEILTDPKLAAKYGVPLFDSNDLFGKGLKISTALDMNYQKIVADAVPPLLAEGTKTYGGKEVPQAAVVIEDHSTGEVKAIYGGTNHTGMLQFDRATDAYRQPGSSIKPIVAYLPAIDLLGWGPSTVIDDSPLMLSGDRTTVWPDNYEHHYNGLQTMRYGVEQSINGMAVRTLQAVTPKKGIDYAHAMGLDSIQYANPADYNDARDEHLALTLGGLTKGVTLLDMTGAYGVLGSLGYKAAPIVITKIENKHGDVVFQASPKKTQVIKHPESVWLMVDVMKGSILRGTASASSKGWHNWPAAGKTGTTENWQDAWFMGFTSDIVTGVWTGYDNDKGTMKRLPGVDGYSWTGAGPPTQIWTAIMDKIYNGKPPKDWTRPQGVTKVQICKTSGLLPSPLCPQSDIISDWFRVGFEPKKVDDVWTYAKVVKQPWIDPKTKKQVVDSSTKKPMERYYLWQEGCGTPENLLMIKRPDTYAMHPTDPYNFARYWPPDWDKEVPKELCTPTPVTPPTSGLEPIYPIETPPPGTQPPGTQPPGTQPPTTPPPGTQPPTTPPPGTQPPSNPPPTTPPPGTEPPTTPPPTTPPPGTQPPTNP